MLIYPKIDSVALQLGAIKIHWYGIMYVLGFGLAWMLALYRAHKIKLKNLAFSNQQISDLIFYAALGVILGGRIGYMLFYTFPDFIANPLQLFKIWQGGMAFHGGLIGVLISVWLFAKKNNQHFLDVTDFIAPFVPIGLGLGRIGNFINAELWGRVTTMPWGMIYPNAGDLPRHPSQIYEALLEGLVLFIVLWFYSAKPKTRGKVSAWFAIGYGCIRFFCEFFREPDAQLGYLAFGWLTMGQLLSLPLILVGIAMLVWSFKNRSKLS